MYLILKCVFNHDNKINSPFHKYFLASLRLFMSPFLSVPYSALVSADWWILTKNAYLDTKLLFSVIIRTAFSFFLQKIFFFLVLSSSYLPISPSYPTQFWVRCQEPLVDRSLNSLLQEYCHFHSSEPTVALHSVSQTKLENFLTVQQPG